MNAWPARPPVTPPDTDFYAFLSQSDSAVPPCADGPDNPEAGRSRAPLGPARFRIFVQSIHHKGTKDTKKTTSRGEEDGGLPILSCLPGFLIGFGFFFVSFVPLW
jgi:hypothetical protein